MSTTTKPMVIGLGGLKEHGKDAVADHLVDKHGFVKIGMSDILADALYILNPIIDEDGTRYQSVVDQVGYTAAKRDWPEVRRLLQNLGTEVGRQILGEDIWISKVVDRIQNLIENEGKSIVVTGIRFNNEVAGLDELGDIEAAYITQWWVNRPGYVAEASTAGHSSENSVSVEEFDEVIENDGDLEQLYERVDGYLNAHLYALENN